MLHFARWLDQRAHESDWQKRHAHHVALVKEWFRSQFQSYLSRVTVSCVNNNSCGWLMGPSTAGDDYNIALQVRVVNFRKSWLFNMHFDVKIWVVVV